MKNPDFLDFIRPFVVVPLAVCFFSQQILQAAGPAAPAPTGGSFVAGAGNISTSGNILTVNQNSGKGIIDWNTFSIGNNFAVKFKNGSGATLNRVIGGVPTTILGQLLATGTVYLLNPEGILVGRSATIHTGGDFLASTLNVSNSNFLSGAPLTFQGNSQAAVINLGDISSSGSNVYLIGYKVQNSGTLSAKDTVGLGSRLAGFPD